MKPFAAIVLAAALLPAGQAWAQDGDSYRVRVGAGAQVRPDFPGADGSEWAPLWKFSVKRGSDPFGFSAPDQSFGFDLISGDRFSAGPVGNIQRGRDDDEAAEGIGKVPTTIEAGAFAQYEVSDNFRLRGEVRQGIGGHEGLVASIGADQVWRDGDDYVVSIGPRLLFSNARYQREFFGVSPEESLVSGVPAYRPGGGLYAVAATSGVHYQLGRDWGLYGFARYERLVGDAADSPIVRELGSRNQLSAGVALTHSFTVDW